MIKTIKTSFILLKENLILVQPLIIFMIIFGILAQPAMFSKSNIFQAIINGILLYLLFTTFISGWFYMIKLSVKNRNKTYNTPEELGIAQIELLKSFFIGVGEYILPMILNVFLYIVIMIVFAFGVYKLGAHYIGTLTVSKEMLTALSGTSKDIYNYISSPSFTPLMQKQITDWAIYLIASSFVFSVITVFLSAIAFFKTQNPFKILIENIKFTFRNFIDAVIIVSFLIFLNAIISIINLFTTTNILLSVISIFLTVLYFAYYIILVFVYYDQKNENSIDCRA